jgi:hypothetical protein
MKDGSEKKVEDVKTGDELYSEEGNISKVLSITKKHTDGKRLISFKSEGFFFTEDHPFKTKKGWKTVNGHHAYLGTVDDLIDSNGNFEFVDKIEIKSVPKNTIVYDIEVDNTYYAGGFLTRYEKINKG